MRNLKTNEIRVKMTDNERLMLEELADELRMNLSECIRNCIRDKYNSLSISKKLQDKLSGEELVKMFEVFSQISKENDK